MKFIFASGNAHKAKELQELFLGTGIEIIPAPSSMVVEENRDTLFGNAELKAEAYYQKFKMPVVSDDSGLFVASLPNDLGVNTARYGGEGLSAEQRCRLLLKNMAGEGSRDAYFACVLCFVLSPKETFFFEGRLAGAIGHQLLGDGGFGYDPIFLPHELKEGEFGPRSLAQDEQFKMENSHRARAATRAKSFLISYLGPSLKEI